MNKPGLLLVCGLFIMATDTRAQLVDTQTPTNALPVSGSTNWTLVFSDEFNTNVLDTTKWGIDVSATSRGARQERGISNWFWKAENVSLDGSNLVLAVTKPDASTMYCGSISSDGLYEPKFGYMEARVQVADITKDTHTAFWMQGHNMTNPSWPADGTAHDGAEIDIFETPYFSDTATTTVHIDGYGSNHKATGGSFSAPGIHSGFHVFGFEWNAISMKVYYDGVLKWTFSGDYVVHTNEWLWLSNGASFYDIGTFTNEPLGFLTDAKFDYVRVWQASENYAPVFTSDPIGKPAATVGEVYSDTLSTTAKDGELDTLTFSRLSGPAWLSVASDGTLTGTPMGADVGTNSWQVQVTDGNGGTNSAELEIGVKNPWDPVVLVGGSILNGNFNAGTNGTDLSYSSTPEWYNLDGNQGAVATKTDETYDGTQNAVVQSGRLPGIDTGHTIEEGESFDISYVWKDSWNWVDNSDQINVSLFVTDDNTITGTRTDLVTHDSGISTINETYESIDVDRIYTTVAGDAGKTLFFAIETTSAGFARIDNVELLVRPAYIKPDMQVFQGGVLVAVGDTASLGTVLTGETAHVSFAVTNLASASTNLYLTSSPAVVFSDNDQTSYNGFTIATNISGTATNLTAGEMEPFVVQFSTNVAGVYAATLSIANSDIAMNPYTFTLSASVTDDADAPTWSDEFDGTGAPDPSKWWLEEGYKRNNEDQYYMTSGNAWQTNGALVIEARREPMGGYEYTSASLRSQGLYSWQYGRAQIRAKLPCLAGMWPAIWMVGDVGEWPSNGECDIMEWYSNKTLSNCARGTTTRWTAAWDSANMTMTTAEAVDPGWRTNWHVWTIQWDQENVRLYCDNKLMNTTTQSWLTNPTTDWGPLKPFMQPHSLWLNLAIGGNAGGDPSGTSFPQHYYVDYWRVWEGATNNVAPTDISISSNTVSEGLAAGSVVGYLSAMDPDPAEVIRYSLVAGTGDDDNSLFSIPEFVSDNTTTGLLKTAAILDYDEGASRSIRVRATDIEGATYEKILTIHVSGDPRIDVTTHALSIAEGSTNMFGVKLRTLPANTVTVNVSRVSGDADLSVQSGAELIFTPTNGTNWQQVVLAAAEDGDVTNGIATFLAQDLAGRYVSVSVEASEIDNDKLTPTVDTWPTASSIMDGQALSNSVLSGGSASVTGDFSFDHPEVIPPLGVYTAAVSFIPDDTETYASVSGSVDVTVSAEVPSVPTELSAVPSKGQVDLSWVASSNTTSYNVKRSTTQGGGYATIGTPAVTNYSDISVANGETYYYVVSAVGPGGESAHSSEVNVTLMHAVPFAEDFETLNTVDLNGQNGWVSSNAVVQTNRAIETQGGRITSATGYAEQWVWPVETNVWTDFMIQPVFYASEPQNVDTSMTAVLYFNTNGNPVVFNGTNTEVVTEIAVTNGAWVRITINTDYVLKDWDLYVDDTLAATNLGFYNTSVTHYAGLYLSGGSNEMAFDEVSMGTVSPFGVQYSFTVGSLYGTPIPSGTNWYASGSTVHYAITDSPVVITNDTKYDVMGWVRAGSEPTTGTTTNDSFTITTDTTLTWQWSTNYWVELNTAGE